ncbi:CARDB domain-containing protein, partial [Bradyrhizobium sp. GCM10023182]
MDIGAGPSGASTAGIYLSSDANITTSDTLLTTVSSGALTSVGLTGYYDHQTLSVTLPGNLAPGTYYLGGIADYNNQVSESNETNNTYNTVRITVGAPVSITLNDDNLWSSGALNVVNTFTSNGAP